MADYYTKFSVIIIMPTSEAREDILEIHDKMVKLRNDDEEKLIIKDLPGYLPDYFHDLIDNEGIHEQWCFDCKAQAHPELAIWLDSFEGGVHAAACLCQYILMTYFPDNNVAFEFSNDCSKPRIDAYGGGAVFITKESMEFFNTGDWLSKKQSEHESKKQLNAI